MTALDRTRALMVELAKALGYERIPADNDGGFPLDVGDDIKVILYGTEGEKLLIVAPIAPLPPEIGHGLALYLLRANMFDAETAPFRVGADRGGTLIFWGRLPIDQLNGESLARLLERVGTQVRDMRVEIAGD